jgi:2-keto-4-pentenoate hydratase
MIWRVTPPKRRSVARQSTRPSSRSSYASRSAAERLQAGAVDETGHRDKSVAFEFRTVDLHARLACGGTRTTMTRAAGIVNALCCGVRAREKLRNGGTVDRETVVDALWRGAHGERIALTQWNGVLTLAAAAAAQLALLERYVAAGDALGGWKVGMTSGRSRDAFGAGVRPFGFVLASRILSSGTRIPLAGIHRAGVENELCFLIERPLAGASVTPAEARAAVGAVAPAFEINETRLDDGADDALRLADDLSQWGVVIGAWQRPVPADVDWEAIEVALVRDGVEVERQRARGHIDDHFASIAALARALAPFDRGLTPGEHIITGAFTRQRVAVPSRWSGRFEPFGRVDVEFTG